MTILLLHVYLPFLFLSVMSIFCLPYLSFLLYLFMCPFIFLLTTTLFSLWCYSVQVSLLGLRINMNAMWGPCQIGKHN